MFGNYNVNFTTSTANTNILQVEAVRDAIMERMGINSQDDYENIIDNKHLKMRFDIFFSGANTVSVNGGHKNSLIKNVVYSSGDFVVLDSIVIETPTTATLSFNIQ